MSTRESLDTLKRTNKFYKKNGISFTVSVPLPSSPTTAFISFSFAATSTYVVTAGRTLYITDLSTNNTGSAGQQGIWTVEIPSGTVVYQLLTVAQFGGF